MSNFIRVLRNGSLFKNRAAALTGLQGKLEKLQDGEICIASYGATWDAAKTILGVVRLQTVDGAAKRSYTIFDNEANSAEIAAEIAKLDATVRGNLTDGDVIQTDKHVGVKVVEVDGKLTEVKVVESDIASAKLLGKETDAAGTNTAFGRIAKEVADRTTAITNAINALDSTVAADAESNNQLSVLTGVKQTDGKLAERTQVKLAAVAKTGSASDVANAAITGNDTYAAVEGTTVSAQISSIAKTLKTITNNDLKYITVKLSDNDASALGANVKEAYQVFAYTGTWNAETKEGTPVGEAIKIYKDASIHKIYLGSEADTINKTTGVISTVTPTEANLRLNYAYQNANGTYELVKIPVDSFLRESEFKDGLQVNSGVVSVKVDTTSEGAENFLSVGQNGVKISGVQNAINTAIGKLDADIISTGSENVTVKVAETDGKVSKVTVTTKGLALDSAVVKNVTVNNVEATVSGNNATVTIDGADIAVADNYTATVYPGQFEAKVGADNHIKADDKIDAALKKAENTISVLATEVISNEKVTTAAVSKLAESAGVLGEGGVIDYVPDTSTTYIKTATSVHDATVKLDAAIKNLGAGALTSLNGSDAITVSGDTANSKTVSLKLGTGATGDNALVINADGLYLSNVWDCGTY